MKVLIGIPCLLTGGTEIQTLNLVKALILGGHNVTVACYFEFATQMVANYEAAGCKVICMSPDRKRIHGWRSIIFLYKNLKMIVKAIKPDVVHVQYMNPGAVPILLLKLLGVKTVIATVHTMADIYSSLRLIHFIQRFCVRAFTCITQTAEQSFFGSSRIYAQDLLLCKRNHFTIFNALPNYIDFRLQPRQFIEPLTLGVVSRLERIKGMDLVIPAFTRLSKEYPNLKLIIVGDGSLATIMKKQAEENEVSRKIHWLGRVCQKDLQECYDRIDVLLVPSRSEGFGLTAIEGMARGCIVVAARTGGLQEIVTEERSGLLHESESVEDIARCVRKVLKDKRLQATLSIKAIEDAKKYSFGIYADRFNSLYKKLDAECLF